MRRAPTERAGLRQDPGDVLLHPVALLSLSLWLLNDHVLKARWGNMLTGKLSDVAALVFFPLLVVALVELLAWALGRPRWWSASRKVVVVAAALTGLVMVTINLFEPCAQLYRHALGLAQWPLSSASALWSGQALSGPGTVDLTMDPTDLATLPALLVPLWLVSHRTPVQDILKP